LCCDSSVVLAIVFAIYALISENNNYSTSNAHFFPRHKVAAAELLKKYCLTRTFVIR